MIIGRSTGFLNELQLGDKGKLGSLRHLAFVIGESEYETVKNASKEEAVALLRMYYCSPNVFGQLWNSLSDAERKITSWHIWGSGSEPMSCADEVAAEFGITENREQTYYFYSYSRCGLERFKTRYAKKSSKLWLLFPKSGDNYIFNDELCDAVGEMKRMYSKVSNKLAFSTRENRASDFSNIVRCGNSTKLTITKNGILSKSSALKLRDFCGYEEYAADFGEEPEDVRATQGLLVTFPLTVLCTVGGLLAASEGVCIPGGKSLSLLSLPHEQLVKKLFDAYLKSKSFDEISVMKGIKPRRGHNSTAARQNLVNELRYCPLGESVYTYQLERYLRIASKAFARKDERYVVSTGNNYYDYGVEWEQYESPLINIILSFFGALGMIDLAWGGNSAQNPNSGQRIPIAFRINPLGAYVLGLSDSYTAPPAPKVKIKGGFTVLPDYTIIVPDSADRLKHEVYFEKLFTKISATEEASIYRLDFETVIRTIDSGAAITDLRKYLSASDKLIPENVTRALDDWEKQADRIKLRQVTILECDDAALLEEVIRYKGMGELVKERIGVAVVVEGSATNKIKKVIEKNRRLCKDVI